MALPDDLNMTDVQLIRLCRAQDAEIDLLRAALKPFAELGTTGIPNQTDIDRAQRAFAPAAAPDRPEQQQPNPKP